MSTENTGDLSTYDQHRYPQWAVRPLGSRHSTKRDPAKFCPPLAQSKHKQIFNIPLVGN
jgi:hypothetical protein